MTSPKRGKTCFVIAPIGEAESHTRVRSDQVLRHLIAPAALECGLSEPVRADSIASPGIITSQVIDQLLEADIVIADLSDANANVFYELAIRHAVRAPVIQLIEEGQRIPFDVATSRTITFDLRDPDAVEATRGELVGQIRAVLDHPERIQNPISITVDLRALRTSEDPEGRSIAEIGAELAKIGEEVRKLRHDTNALDRFKMWERMVSKMEKLTKNIQGFHDLDDIASEVDDVESSVSDLESKIDSLT